MKLTQSLVLAAGSLSLVAAQAHHHAHRHLHNVHNRRDTIVETVAEVAYVYQLGDEVVEAADACKGIKDGKYQWGEGAPEGACGAVGKVTSLKTVTPTSTPTPAAVFIEKPSTKSSSTTPTSTSTSTPPPPPPPPPPSTTSSSAVAAPTPGTSEGGVTIFNNVGKTLYLWSTNNIANPMITLPQGKTYTETWQLNPDLGGISIKVSTTPNEDDVLQFEYTLVTDTIWWDVSLINMLVTSLFDKLGFTVTSNDKTCRDVTCPAGETQCNDAYLWPTDDQATRACPKGTNMVLNLGPA